MRNMDLWSSTYHSREDNGLSSVLPNTIGNHICDPLGKCLIASTRYRVRAGKMGLWQSIEILDAPVRVLAFGLEKPMWNFRIYFAGLNNIDFMWLMMPHAVLLLSIIRNQLEIYHGHIVMCEWCYQVVYSYLSAILTSNIYIQYAALHWWSICNLIQITSLYNLGRKLVRKAALHILTLLIITCRLQQKWIISQSHLCAGKYALWNRINSHQQLFLEWSS